MKPRYRFKGRHPNKERKMVIEYLEKGKMRTFTLPKAGTLLNVLNLKGKNNNIKDVKTSSLGETKVHETDTTNRKVYIVG